MKGPTQRQLVVLRILYDHQAIHGYAPSMREVAHLLGTKSLNGVNDHYRHLGLKGLVQRTVGSSRTVVITDLGLAALQEKRPAPPKGAEYMKAPRRGPHWMRGYIYFVEAVGSNRIKIGFTRGDPRERAKLLQTGCPFPLELILASRGTMWSESKIHHHFTHLRVAPNVEWFHDAPELREFIQSIEDADRKFDPAHHSVDRQRAAS